MRKFCSFVLVLAMLVAMSFKTFAYWEGDTKVVTNWWGVEIYLSKSTVQHIGEGTAVCGVFIPEPLVTKILAVYGFGIRFLPGGIVLEYDYIKMGGWRTKPRIRIRIRVSESNYYTHRV